MNYSYAYWFSRAEDELFLLMIMLIDEKNRSVMKILYRNGKMICFEKKKIRREFYPFPNHLFTHTHIFANNLSSLHTCIRLFYVCKCPVADPRRPSLCFSSRIEKKTRWETCSHSSENRFNRPSRTSHRFSHTVALSIGKKETILLLSSVHFDLISHRMMIIGFQKILFAICASTFSHRKIIDLYDWVSPTVYNDLFRNDFIHYDFIFD